MSKIEDNVIIKIAKRTMAGLNKYGTTMERTDLNFLEWLQHLQEELMDAAVYVERLMQEASQVTEEATICTNCGEFNCTC